MGKMRLDKLLANNGLGSRTEIKQLIKTKKVMVNQQLAKTSQLKVDPEQDDIRVEQQQVTYQEFVYYLLHKPAGVVSATEDAHERTVLDLINAEDLRKGLFPVGRLDKDTEGLLLLTNDGPLAHALLAPKKHVPKIYFAEIDGVVTPADVVKFTAGLILTDGFQCQSAALTILTIDEQDKTSTIEVTIHEGKFHQVKRMFLAVGKKVVYLKRIQMGDLALDKSLVKGQYRALTAEEINKLQKKKTTI